MVRCCFPLLALLLGCASTTPPATPYAANPAPPPPLTPERVNALIGEVATLRGLSPLAPVPIYLLDEAAFVVALRERIGGESDTGEQEQTEAFVRGFHLVPDASASARVTSAGEVLEEQVLAFYDHERHHVVARKVQPKTKQEADRQLGVLAHEIEHALQDQHFPRQDMAQMSGYDEQLAYRAILEGDAMLAMIAFQAADHGIPFSRAIRRFSDLVKNVPIEQFVHSERGSALDHALPILRERLLFPYHSGAGMVADIYRAGGLSLVNNLLARRPVSTEQVLHPEKYLAGDLPAKVKIPNVPAGYRIISSDALGELQIRVVLSPCAATDVVKRAAEGWAGDRYTLVAANDGAQHLLWTTVWDTEADASEFAQLIGANPQCLGGGVRMAANGKIVGVVRGLPDAAADDAAKALLALAGDKPPAAPIGNYLIPPATPPPKPQLGYFMGDTYMSQWLGIVGMMPRGFTGRVGFEGTELSISLRGFATSGTVFLSDKMTTPRFVEELFQQVVAGSTEAAPNRKLVPIGGGSVSLALGPAVDRFWQVADTSMTIRAVILPICNGTGSIVFLESSLEPWGKDVLDTWLYSFRWTSSYPPPICELLNPR